MVRNRSLESRGDGSELLFGDTVVQGGLHGSPGVADGCWWVVRIAVLVFDEFLGMVVRSSVGHKDGWGQVDARVPVELSLLFSFGHEAWAGAGC